MSREQLGLFEHQPFSPVFPSLKSHEGEILQLLLSGEKLVVSETESMLNNWLLSNCISNLIYKGWPIVEMIFYSKQRHPILQYHLPEWVLVEVGAKHG